MATITSAASGNFSAPATWVGGVVPGVADDAVAATGHVVTIDVDVTVISVQQAGTGKFTLGNGRTLTGNVIANAGTFTSGGTVEVTATTGNTATIQGNLSGAATSAANVAAVVMTGTGTLTINGSVTGSATNVTTANGNAMVYTNVTNIINVNGVVSAGSGQEKRALMSDTGSNTTWNIIGNVVGGTGQIGGRGAAIVSLGNSATINVTGNVSVSGGDGRGIMVEGTGPVVNVTGNVSINGGNRTYAIFLAGSNNYCTLTVIGNMNVSGSPSASNAILCQGDLMTCYITGNITHSQITGGDGNPVVNAVSSSGPIISYIGTAQAGSMSASSHAIANNATTANKGVIFQGNMIDSSLGTKAVYTRIFRLTATNSGYTQYQNNVTWPLGSPVYRVSPDNVTGMPAASNVRKPVVYGYSNQLTGTMAVPSAGSVASGVPVDNTTGTAILDLDQVAEAIGLQVAAGKST